MPLWALHPKYLDGRGLVALWHEALLARAVLRGVAASGRRDAHVDRFRAHPTPRSAINAYLEIVHLESLRRGYWFDRGNFGRVRPCARIDVTQAQVRSEWARILRQLEARSLDDYRRWKQVRVPDLHPLFRAATR